MITVIIPINNLLSNGIPFCGKNPIPTISAAKRRDLACGGKGAVGFTHWNLFSRQGGIPLYDRRICFGTEKNRCNQVLDGVFQQELNKVF